MALLCSIGTAIVVSMLYIMALKLAGGSLLPLSTVLVQVVLLGGAVQLFRSSTSLRYEHDPHMKLTLQFTCLLLLVFAVGFCLWSASFLKRVYRAWPFVQYGSRILTQLQSRHSFFQMLSIPLLQCLLISVVLGWGCIVSVCLFAGGKTETTTAVLHPLSGAVVSVPMEEFVLDYKFRWMVLYLWISLFWWLHSILSVG